MLTRSVVARTVVGRRAAARIAFAGLGLVVAVGLAGCVTPGSGDKSSPPASTPSASVSPSPSSSPSESTSPSAESPTPVSIPCGSVVKAQTIYDFNPNFGLLASFSPAAGTLTARAVADQGTTCRWQNQTSGDTIDVTISQPGPNALVAARNAAASGTSVSGMGDAAYFSLSGHTGLIQVFAGQFWVTSTSVYYSSADDARSIMADAVAAAR